MRRRLRDGRDGRALVEELERIGEALPAGPEKSHWFLELGVACEMLVPERLRALQLYGRAVDIDHATSEAIDRGRMVSRELGRIDEFIRLTEIELQHEPDDERKERLATLIGEALLDLGDRQRAAAFLVRAAGQFPSSLAIQDALGTVGYDDDWRSELDRLIAIGEDAEDADAGARVSLRAARVLRMEAPEDERYEQLLQRTLYYDPYNESAHQLLDALYASAGRWDDLEELEHQLVRAFPGADEQAALCQRFSFGWIARGQHDRAAAWCWRAIELGRLVYPIAGLTMLRGLYASRRDWDRLLSAVDALMATPLDEDADVHTSLLGGTIAWKAKNDLARAGVYFERVRRVALDSPLVVDFDDAVADHRNPEIIGEEQRALMEAARRIGKMESIERSIEAWKRASAADPSKRAPRRALARVLYRSERWRTLADALRDEEVHACRDDGERVALLFQLVALYRDRLRQDLLLTAALQRILELQPGNLVALDQLEAAFAGMRRWPEVAATIARKLPFVTEAKERVELQLRLAEIWQERLGNEPEAIKALAEALVLEPTREGLAERLERAYTKRREWDKLFALKQTQLATLAEPAARLAAHLELAQLAMEKLKKPALAIDAYREVLAIDGDHEGALAALERLYLAAQSRAPLADIYARRAAQTVDAATQLAYLTKLAQLYGSELDDAPRAIDSWRRVLALQPGHLRAREMLRKLYVGQGAWDELQALFADDGRLDECARLYERQAAEAPPELQPEAKPEAKPEEKPEEKSSCGCAPAACGARRSSGATPPSARSSACWRWRRPTPRRSRRWRRCTKRRARRKQARRRAGAAAGDAERRGDRQGAAAAPGGAARARAARRGRRLPLAAGGVRRATRSTRAVRAELEQLATRSGRWPELVAAYERIAAERAGVDRVALLSTVARQKEAALGDVDGALVTWRELAAAQPPPPEALEALVRIYEARAAWRELHDVYARKLELCRGTDERRPIVMAMAALAERQGDDVRAIAAYRRLADELGADDATLEALERLHERAGSLDAVEAVLLERLGLPGAARQRTALTFRLAEVRRRRERLPDAIVLYGEVLDAEPNHAGARAGAAGDRRRRRAAAAGGGAAARADPARHRRRRAAGGGDRHPRRARRRADRGGGAAARAGVAAGARARPSRRGAGDAGAGAARRSVAPADLRRAREADRRRRRLGARGGAVQGDRHAAAQHRRARRGALPPRRALSRSPARRRAGAAHLRARARSGARPCARRSRDRRAVGRRRPPRRAGGAPRRRRGAPPRCRRRARQGAPAGRPVRARARRARPGDRDLRAHPGRGRARGAGVGGPGAALRRRHRAAEGGRAAHAVVSRVGARGGSGAHLDGGAGRVARRAAARRADGAGALGRPTRRAGAVARGRRRARASGGDARGVAAGAGGARARARRAGRRRGADRARARRRARAPRGAARARCALRRRGAARRSRRRLAPARRRRGAGGAARAQPGARRAAGDGARRRRRRARHAGGGVGARRRRARRARAGAPVRRRGGDGAVAARARRPARRRRVAHRAGGALRAPRSLLRAGRGARASARGRRRRRRRRRSSSSRRWCTRGSAIARPPRRRGDD